MNTTIESGLGQHQGREQISYKNSIAKRLIFYIVLFSSLITLIATAIQLYRDYHNDLQSIDRRLELIRHAHMDGVAHAHWVFDYEERKILMTGILRLPDIAKVEVIDQGKVIAQVGNKKSKDVIIKKFPLEYSKAGNTQQIGTLRITVTLDEVYSRLYNKLLSILVANGVKTFLVAAFIFLLFQYLVTRHLKKLATYGEQMRLHNLHEGFEFDRSRKSDKPDDELDLLADSMNVMRKQLQTSINQVRAAEEQYRNLITLVHEGIWLVDINGKSVYANPALLKLLGYTENEMMGRDLRDFIADSLAFFEQMASSTPADALVVQHEVELIAKSGEHKFVQLISSAVFDEGERYQGMVSVVIDLTDKYDLLMQSRSLMSAIDQSVDFIAMMDQSYKFTYLNHAARQALSVDSDERGDEPMTLDRMVSDPKTAEEVKERIVSDKTWIGEIKIRNRQESVDRSYLGEMILIEHPVKQKATTIVMTLRDLTEIKRSELRLREHRDQLEKLVKLRTKALEHANRELESFCYSVSHDLRAPLRAIGGFSDILVDECASELTAEASDYLNRIRSNALRMSDLIDDLLNLSRVSSMSIQVATVNLSALAITIMSRIRSETQLQVEFAVEPNLLTVADSKLMEIALTNLLENACKYSSRQADAKIEMGRIQQDGRDVFFVRDNGVGFNMEYADQLFAPFQRQHSEKDFPGTGVGLATVQRVVHRLGGEVWAHSEENKGATFYFYVQPKDIQEDVPLSDEGQQETG